MFNSQTRVRRVLVLIIVTAGACGIAACSRQPSNNSEPTPVLSRPPNTTFPMPPIGTDASSAEVGWILADGKRLVLSDYRGKVLILDFYATWCEPCRKSIPHLIDLQRRYEAKGLQLVGLNVGGPDDRVKVASFADEFHITYPLGFPDQSLMDLFLADDSTIPQTFIFNRDGKLVKRFIGYDDSMPGQLEQVVLAELISKSK